MRDKYGYPERSLVVASYIARTLTNSSEKARGMFTVKGYCAMIRLFHEDVYVGELDAFIQKKRALLESLELILSFGGGVRQPATELCYDVYDKTTGKWRDDLSRSFKIKPDLLYDWVAQQKDK